MTAVLTFHQPFGSATRILVALAGCATLIAPYELLIRPGVPVLTLGMIPFWFIALGALSVGAVFFVAALFGLSKTTTFDPSRRVMDVRGEGSFGLRFSRAYAFTSLGAVTVDEDRDTDGPLRYRLLVAIAGRKRPFEISTFAQRADAEAAAASVRAMLTA